MRFKKAFFFGRKGRGGLRTMVRRAMSAHAKTGREHGFHVGRAGADRTLTSGKAKTIRWPTRISVGTASAGGTLHHTHPRGRSLSPGDLRSVVTAKNPKGGRNTLWAHSPEGSVAARLTRRAADKPLSTRAKLFRRAMRETGAGKYTSDDAAQDAGDRLRRRLKRYGVLHSGTSRHIRKALETIAKRRRGGVKGPSAQQRRRSAGFDDALRHGFEQENTSGADFAFSPMKSVLSNARAMLARRQDDVGFDDNDRHILKPTKSKLRYYARRASALYDRRTRRDGAPHPTLPKVRR